MSDQATDEEVAEMKAEHRPMSDSSQCLSWRCRQSEGWPCPTAKLLARLEAVERERAQIERDLKFCEEELAAGEW